MLQEIRQKVYKRIARRILKSPRFLFVHAVAFTFGSSLLGILNLIRSQPGAVDGVIYWTVFLWSIVFFIHAAYTYFNSGARLGARQAITKEEIADAADTYGLTEEQRIVLQHYLLEDVTAHSRIYRRLLRHAEFALALWPGMMVATLFLRFSQDFVTTFNLCLMISWVGTFLLGVTLPYRQFLFPQYAELNIEEKAKRGEKPKRSLEELDMLHEINIPLGDDGELLSDQELARRRASQQSKVRS